MSHKPNLLSWDQDVAASPREFHETDNNRTNYAALLATWQYFSFRHIRFSKLLSYQKLSQIILFYFFKCFDSRARQKKFLDLPKIIIFCKNKSVSKTQTSKTQTSDPKNSDPEWVSRKLRP